MKIEDLIKKEQVERKRYLELYRKTGDDRFLIMANDERQHEKFLKEWRKNKEG